MGSYIRDFPTIMEHGLAGSTFGDLRVMLIVINSAVFVLTNNALPLLFFLPASDRGFRLSGAQRYLMDNPDLQICAFGDGY